MPPSLAASFVLGTTLWYRAWCHHWWPRHWWQLTAIDGSSSWNHNMKFGRDFWAHDLEKIPFWVGLVSNNYKFGWSVWIVLIRTEFMLMVMIDWKFWKPIKLNKSIYSITSNLEEAPNSFVRDQKFLTSHQEPLFSLSNLYQIFIAELKRDSFQIKLNKEKSFVQILKWKSNCLWLTRKRFHSTINCF